MLINMILSIDTSKNDKLKIALKTGKRLLAQKEIAAEYSQAELLLPEIEKMLLAEKVKLSDIKKIMAANKGEGFTALRIGIATANALGFALGVPVNQARLTQKNAYSIVKPIYNREPNITLAKK